MNETTYNGIALGNSRYDGRMGLCLCDENGNFITDDKGNHVPADPKRRGGINGVTYSPETLRLGQMTLTRTPTGGTLVEMPNCRPLLLNEHPINKTLFGMVRRLVRQLATMQTEGTPIVFTTTADEQPEPISTTSS